MTELVQGGTLRCELNGERTHDRCAGVCYYLDGADITAIMVRQGSVRDCARLRCAIARRRRESRAGLQ